ncbi:MAG: sulfatase-like hydrolase/transferase [Planctomycetaceae bacterium]
MTSRPSSCGAMLAGIAMLAAACAGGRHGLAADPEQRNLRGWTVHVDARLLDEMPEQTTRALDLLDAQLGEIERAVPAAAVARLREVPLHLSPEYAGVPPRAEYHPDPGWLRDHGRDPAMARAVEFTNVRIFEAETVRMPNFALHELAHAYHHRVLPQGFDNPAVRAAFERATASGGYDAVERRNGAGRPPTTEKAYALTTPQEFFAETTEAFFSANDFFPFTKADLARHDPETAALLARLWGVAAGPGGLPQPARPQLGPVARGAAGERPNIVILYADDMGFGDLGANNPASKIPTPHLDRLAAEGMRFTDAHSSSGICSPSRYALLTGRHHWRDFHDIVNSFGASAFKAGQLTLPEMLRRQGYATACIGKWHLGWNWNAIRRPGTKPTSHAHGDFDWARPIPGGPLDHGFDTYFGDDVINFPPYAWIENDRVVEPPDTTLEEVPGQPKEGRWECRPGPARSDWDFYRVLPTLTERAEAFVRARKGDPQPFFLYVPLPSPHAPIIPTDEFDGRSQAGPFGDFVAQTDDACGRVLTALRESGLENTTIVVFSADNGAEVYAYARDAAFDHWSSAPFRGIKRDLYEGGHHVPFLLRWPGVTRPGAVSDALVSQVDLMATLAAAVGFDLPADAAADSHDLLPWLTGRAAAPPRTTIVHNTNAAQYAIRHGDWLLVDGDTGVMEPKRRSPPAAWNEKHRYPADDGQPVELFDLRNDVGQRRNLAAERPQTVADLRDLLARTRAAERSAPAAGSGAQTVSPSQEPGDAREHLQ